MLANAIAKDTLNQHVRYTTNAIKILDLIESDHREQTKLGPKPRFVLFGASGSGKTSSLDYANRHLQDDNQIAENHDLLFRSPEEAYSYFQQDDSEYQGCSYVAYSICSAKTAEYFAQRGVKVITIDRVEPIYADIFG